MRCFSIQSATLQYLSAYANFKLSIEPSDIKHSQRALRYDRTKGVACSFVNIDTSRCKSTITVIDGFYIENEAILGFKVPSDLHTKRQEGDEIQQMLAKQGMRLSND